MLECPDEDIGTDAAEDVGKTNATLMKYDTAERSLALLLWFEEVISAAKPRESAP